MESKVRQRLQAKSDEVLAEADRLDAIERTLDALPEGSQEIVQTAEHAEGQAARLRDVAAEDEAMTRDVARRAVGRDADLKPEVLTPGPHGPPVAGRSKETPRSRSET